jgi:hypothetical protein
VQREGRGHEQEPRAGQGVQAVEFREAQVIADGQAGDDALDVGGHDAVTAAHAGGLPVARLPGEADVEQVQLVVAGC